MEVDRGVVLRLDACDVDMVMDGMQVINPDPGRHALGRRVAHVAAVRGIVADPMQVQARDGLAIGVIGEPESNQGALPIVEGEPRLIVDDLAEGLVLMGGRGYRAQDDIGEVTGDLDRAHDLVRILVGVMQVAVDRRKDSIDVRASGDVEGVLASAMGSDPEGDALLRTDLTRGTVDGHPPGEAPDADDLTIEVVHHADPQAAAAELLPRRRAR